PPRARRRLATGRTVHAEPALKFGDMGSQRRNQRDEFFSRWLCLRFGIHRILESKSDSAVEKILHGCLREKMQPNLASYMKTPSRSQATPCLLAFPGAC